MCALALNFARVAVLACLLEFRGPETTARWHDPAGAAATTLLFLSLIYLATFGARKLPPALAAPPRAPLAPAWPGWGAALGGCSAVIAATLLAPTDTASTRLWQIDAARLPAGWTARREALTPSEQRQLHRGAEERWHLRYPDGGEAYIIYLHWKAGTQTEATAYPHSPGLCLPSQGWVREGEVGELVITGHPPRTFDSYHFSQQTARLVALRCLSSGGACLPAPAADRAPAWQRILAALCRRPSYVSEDLLIYLPEPVGSQATAAVTAQIVRAFRVVR